MIKTTQDVTIKGQMETEKEVKTSDILQEVTLLKAEIVFIKREVKFGKEMDRLNVHWFKRVVWIIVILEILNLIVHYLL